MTTTAARPVTHGSLLLPPQTRGTGPEDPPARARARARVEDTLSDGKSGTRRGLIPAVRAAVAAWWAWTATPATLADTWTASAVAKPRVPGKSGLLTFLWKISNGTDRLLMFGLILIAPTGLTGPLRWAATRPTRRYGTYALTGVLLLLVTLHR